MSRVGVSGPGGPAGGLRDRYVLLVVQLTVRNKWLLWPRPTRPGRLRPSAVYQRLAARASRYKRDCYVSLSVSVSLHDDLNALQQSGLLAQAGCRRIRYVESITQSLNNTVHLFSVDV